jgi:hypothetical protein
MGFAEQQWIDQMKEEARQRAEAQNAPAVNRARREESIGRGAEIGQKEFYDDPDMIKMRQLREDLAKGYSGQELGNIREQARGEIRGAQATQQSQLASNLGRGGVGGARAAAIKGAQGQQGAKGVADAERKIAMDSANMQKQGASDLQDFIFRQKQGKMGTAFGYAGLDSADYAAQMAKEANRGGGKK